ncbi:zinc finger FYVE domain-containing protein 16 isoform X2 [Syngnathus scovelli]|uniref:zinc finger FYVE domain-containing protein 16 isoform X2 n=1 Tax=Syngnathus scovelli TaxID=161590 RepID=UPI00211082A6|nr:zinc finger FYVE domain-containing protein 16 isoform X2 [Syngnathus scovelli]
MDSFFKAAVCDLDKVLDDFELSADEVARKSVFGKSPPYKLTALGSSGASGVPPDLPDLSALRYGGGAEHNGEAPVQPLTDVDLLSSVDRGAAQSSAPPCPDRALEPVCDLVNDTGSAVLLRADSHDAFGELDAAERRLEEEEKEMEESQEEAELLLDFSKLVLEDRDMPSRNSNWHQQLSLLDIILPAFPAEDVRVEARDDGDAQDEGYEEETPEDDPAETSAQTSSASLGSPEPPAGPSKVESPPESDNEAPVSSPGERPEDEGTEADSLSALDVSCREEPLHSISQQQQQRQQERCVVELPAPVPPAEALPSQPSPVDLPEFGFEYLPESDQAELLVTDEELDAFLRAEAERAGVSVQPGEAALPPDGELAYEEPRSCAQALRGPASPESDRSVPTSSLCRDLPCPATEQQHISHGGARPKQPLPPAAATSSQSADEKDEEQEENHDADRNDEEEEESPPCMSPGFLPHSLGGSLYAAPEPPEYTASYEELSEPPPYPGEGGAGPAGWTEEEPGGRQPAWVPDSEAPNCMNCSHKFTFTKRRHHCRACGKVYCAGCCNRKCKLKYLEKEARVCVVCFDTLQRAQALERMMSPTGPGPNPNVPSQYCSTIPPLQQARAAGTLNSPPPTVMVPVSALKHPGGSDGCPREHKRVWFADGILPNGEVADTGKLAAPGCRSSPESEETALGPGVPEGVPPPPCGPWHYALLAGLGSAVRKAPSLLPDSEDQLPPLLIATAEDAAGADVLVEESPAPCQIRHLLEEGGPRPLTFVLNANLLVNVKMVTYGERECWCLGSNGLRALGQRELVFLLERVPEDRTPPRDLFALCLSIQQDAQRGKFVDELDNVTFAGSFLGSKDHGGMLFFSPTCQPLEGLTLPSWPFLFGLLIQKLEVPWAKVFPLRLLLRLGAEYDVYPSTPVSVRFRESVYRETGHTIMNLLADLRNYQYSLASVEGLRVHMEVGRSFIDIPKSSFGQMQRVLSGANEHVITVGATLSLRADSHLVCFQNEDGSYRTQAASVPGKTRTVTGASFVVFNGALKASSGFIAKSSIVEDGLMVQMPPETMDALRAALREQNDFNIACGRTDEADVRENVAVRWLDWTPPINSGMTSDVDGRSLEGARSVRMRQDAEFECDGHVIACSEVTNRLVIRLERCPSLRLTAASRQVFYRPTSAEHSAAAFQKELATAACGALTRHLAALAASAINSFSLRVSTRDDVVEYQAGWGGRPLPQRYTNELDSALIPVIHGGGAIVPPPAPVDMELLFFITHAI